MSKKEPEQEKPVEEEAPKQGPGFISKLLAKGVTVFHTVLVLALLGGFIWQVLNFYSFSTERNRLNAIKTNHMVVFDINTGETLLNLPASPDQAKVAEDEGTNTNTTATTEPEAPAAEIALVIAGIGRDPVFTNEVSTLPAGFIYSYSPYGTGVLDATMKKAAGGSAIAADIYEADGKFDLSDKNSGYRNENNVEAAVSKVYAPVAAVITSVPDSFVSSPEFAKLADKLQKQQTQIILTKDYKNSKANVVTADVSIAPNSSAETIKSGLEKLEGEAKASGYAVGVLQPNSGAAAILKEWQAGLKAKNIKLVSSIRNQ